MTVPPPISSPLVASLAAPAARTRDALARLGGEMATGRAADPGRALRHDFAPLAAAERALATAASTRAAIGHGQRVAAAAEAALARGAAGIEALRDALLPAITGDAAPDLSEVGAAARGALTDLISALSTRVDGRAAFDGGRADAGPFPDPAAILADLDALAAGATDPAALSAAVAAYFAPGGDLAAVRAVPPAGAPLSVRTAPGEAATLDLSATGPEARAALEAVAQVMALAASPAGAADGGAGLAGPAHAALSGAADAVTAMRAATGRFWSTLDRAEARVADAADAAARARGDLIGADPYETATRLEAEAARLETIYALTARLGRLRLTDYLR